MILRPRTFCFTGAVLVAIALLVFGVAWLYVRFTPKIYASSTRVVIRSKSPQAAPIQFADLPLDLFRHDRNLIIYAPIKNSSVFEIRALAPEPVAAANLANQRTRELAEAVHAKSKADFSIIEQAVPNPRPVRPASRKILTISGVVALNVGLVGVICLLAGFWKSRRLPVPAASQHSAT